MQPALDWASIAQTAVARWDTPLYILHSLAIDQAISDLVAVKSELPTRYWLSCKTLGVAPLLRLWRAGRRGAEVVSSFELQAALAEGFAPDTILVNGTAKHRWLCDFDEEGLHVQFDSVKEAATLVSVAKQRRWEAGLRIHTNGNRDPDDRRFADQFGLAPPNVQEVVSLLRRHDVPLTCIGFHLHSNLRTVRPYLEAVQEVAAICADAKLRPAFLDVGGGIPAPGETVEGVDGGDFDLNAMSSVYTCVRRLLPTVREVWLEPGRFICSRAGLLVVRVWDVKEFGTMRYLICDGGRVNHALPSDWQHHTIDSLPVRGGRLVPTTVCGPTCMAYDHLARAPLPCDIQPGDLVMWHNAGAYHIPWETRFSHGLAPIVWCSSSGSQSLAREREDFDRWWHK